MKKENKMADLNDNKLKVKFKKLNENAKSPEKAYSSDAGWDLFALEETPLAPGQTIKIGTGIALEIPEGYCGVIHDRSSLGSKSLTIFGGVIDSPYRGEISVLLHNTFHPNFEVYTHIVNPGDKIAQMLILPVPEVELLEVKELSDSDRAEKGFGSSGK